MAWEWVSPIATATVGLGGIAATWLTARAARIDQTKLLRAQLEESRAAALRDARRESFAALSANISDLITYASFANETSDPTESKPAVHELARALAEVQILGSEAIRQIASQVVVLVLSYLAERLKGGKKADAVGLVAKIHDSLYILQRIMATDLGLALGSSAEEIARTVATLEHAADDIKYKNAQRDDLSS
jgi:hypothetical protein